VKKRDGRVFLSRSIIPWSSPDNQETQLVGYHSFGIIRHRPETFSEPNFDMYHAFVASAVAPRFKVQNKSIEPIVLLMIEPLGAARIVRDR